MSTFTELPLSSSLQKNLAAAQFVTLTPIQESAIPPALEGRDVIGTAQTGTGKTLAFLIPLIEILNREPVRNTVALVLLPTRELAMQVHEQYEQLRTKTMPKAALVIGGVSEKAQIEGLRAGSGLVIATPGRLQDLMNRKFADLRHIKVLVLDEAHLLDSVHTFEALRLLLNIEPGGVPALTLLLVGQPAILPTLDRMPQWEERLAVKCLLRAFSEAETAAYVEHRLRVAGAVRSIVEADAMSTLHALTHGLARRINRLCDLALLVGFAEEQPTLDASHFEAVCRELVAVAPD